jgi:hypothetical protein
VLSHNPILIRYCAPCYRTNYMFLRRKADVWRHLLRLSRRPAVLVSGALAGILAVAFLLSVDGMVRSVFLSCRVSVANILKDKRPCR